MLTDIRSLLTENNIDPAETVYAELPAKITEYPITIGDFNTIVSGSETVEQFSGLLDGNLIPSRNTPDVKNRSKN